MALLLEVIVQSVADARAAARGGADRLEVVRAIRDGGLTPPVALVRGIAAEVSLPLRVIVRENAGYSTNGHELPALREAIATFAAESVDGAVLGFAGRQGDVPPCVRSAARPARRDRSAGGDSTDRSDPDERRRGHFR